MTTELEQAQAELAAVQRKVAALSLLPQDDVYEVGTIIRWGRKGVTQVAVKAGTSLWHVTNDSHPKAWSNLVGMYLRQPVDFFEVAPADWSDARLAPPPPIKTDGLVLTDSAGHTWHRHGDQWVLTEGDN